MSFITGSVVLQIEGLSFFYPTTIPTTSWWSLLKNFLNKVSTTVDTMVPVPAVDSITLPIMANEVTALIGPSGCGKSTLLRCLNRMNDTVERGRYEGSIFFQRDGKNILGKEVDVELLRKRIGMVFQNPNPFRDSIFGNIAYGLRLHGLVRTKTECENAVEDNLRKVGLWDEVKDRLFESARALSGGQQQRLCIARVLAIEPEILLLDEPCSSLDPISTGQIEELLVEIKKAHSIVIVTHNLGQARRISNYVAYMEEGKLIEYGGTVEVFERPRHQNTEKFVRGLIG